MGDTLPYTQKDKKKLYKQRCAVSPGFPSESITRILFEVYRVREFRYCSLQTMEKPQLFHLMVNPEKQWVGQVLVFASLDGYNGKTEEWWGNMFEYSFMQILPYNRSKTRRPLWKEHLETATPAQAKELELNLHVYTDKQWERNTANFPEFKPREVPGEVEGPRAALAIAEAATSEERDSAVKQACEIEDARAFPGQPTKQSLQRVAYRSKNPKSPSAVSLQGVSPHDKRGAAVSIRGLVGVAGHNSITIAEAVKHKSIQGLASDTWQTIALTFLTRSNAYSSTLHRDETPLQVLRRILPGFAASDPFFHWAPQANKTGFAALYPLHDETSSLEHHRAVLAVEAAAEGTLRSIALAVQGKQWSDLAQLQGMDYLLLADLDAALELGGGMEGRGPAYWNSTSRSSDPDRQPPFVLSPSSHAAQGGLRAVIADLASTRQNAFTRLYLIPDVHTWALPLLYELFNVRYRYSEAKQNTAPGAFLRGQVASDYTYAVKKVNEARCDAIKSDLKPLICYGKKMLGYTDRLCQIAKVVGADAVVPVANVISRVPAPRGQRDPEMIKNIQRMLADQMTATLRFLMVFPKIPETCKRSEEVRQAAILAMQGDSHQEQATSCLPPTPSLMSATNEPEKFFAPPAAAAAKSAKQAALKQESTKENRGGQKALSKVISPQPVPGKEGLDTSDSAKN